MSVRILLLVVVGALSGCSLRAISLPKGISLLGCIYGVLPESQPARCMSKAEYKTAKGKLRSTQDGAASKGGKQTDPRYEEWIP